MIYGISLPAELLIFAVLLLSIMLPLVTGKAFYCTHVFPYGCAQDVVGKLIKKPLKISGKLRSVLSSLRESIFAIIVFLLLIGISLDLTDIEPFSAFLFKTASVPVIILAILFLILSLFVRRPWCNYFCPTGQFLEIIRKSIKF
ncbi:MAG: 4Fe-4S binding protein [Marinifilaceae bacterium]